MFLFCLVLLLLTHSDSNITFHFTIVNMNVIKFVHFIGHKHKHIAFVFPILVCYVHVYVI